MNSMLLTFLVSEKFVLYLCSTSNPNRVVVCNIHVLYNPRRGEIKLGQVFSHLTSLILCALANKVDRSVQFHFLLFVGP